MPTRQRSFWEKIINNPADVLLRVPLRLEIHTRAHDVQENVDENLLQEGDFVAVSL